MNKGSQITDESGQVIFTNVLGGGLTFTVSLPGYNTQSGKVDVTTQDESASISMVLTSYYDLAFIVTDSITPLEGASIVVNEINLTTDAGGIATINDIEEGTALSWTVSLADYENASGSLSIINDTSINVSLAKLIISGQENKLQNAIKLFPNPASDRLIITGLNNEADIQILDLNGKVLFRKKSESNRMEVNLANFSRGIYIVNVMENKNIQYFKLILR